MSYRVLKQSRDSYPYITFNIKGVILTVFNVINATVEITAHMKVAGHSSEGTVRVEGAEEKK